jgi:hypothetical protein
MIDRLTSVFIAVCLAMLIWLYSRSREQEVLDHVPVPVDVSLGAGQAEQYNLEVVGAAQVLATFTGPPSRIRELRGLLQRDQLRIEVNYSVPAERLKENRLYETIVVEPADINVPAGVTLALVTGRNQVRIALHRMGEKRLPVRVDPSADTQGGLITVEPPSVLVRGPQEVLDRAGAIPTQSPALGAKHATHVQLVRELEGRPIQCEPCSVRVRVSAPIPKKTYELTDVPVHFLTPATFPFRPRFGNDRAGKVMLRVQGPSQDEPPRLQTFVDLTAKAFSDATGRTALRSGWYDEPVHVYVPPGFTLLDGPPRSVTFELVPVEELAPRLGDSP